MWLDKKSCPPRFGRSCSHGSRPSRVTPWLTVLNALCSLPKQFHKIPMDGSSNIQLPFRTTLSIENEADQKQSPPKFSFKRQDPLRTPTVNMMSATNKSISTQSFYLPENAPQQQKIKKPTSQFFSSFAQQDQNVQPRHGSRHIASSQIARPIFGSKPPIRLKFDEDIVNYGRDLSSPLMEPHTSTFQESTSSSTGLQQPFPSSVSDSSRNLSGKQSPSLNANNFVPYSTESQSELSLPSLHLYLMYTF